MSRSICILALLTMVAMPAPAEAADVCVLVSHRPKKMRATYDAAARALLASIPAERVDAGQLDDTATLRKACGRVAVTVGIDALKAAHKHLDGVPIVYTLAQSAEQTLSGRPLFYGVSASAEPGQLFGILQQIAPEVKRIGVVYDARRTEILVTLAERVAEGRGLELVALEVDSTAAAIKAFHRFEKEIAIDALWFVPDSTVMKKETGNYALELAHWGRLPVIAPSRGYVGKGALFALVPNPEVHGRLAAKIAGRLLRGERPPALQYASDNHLLLSQRMADKLGFRLPPELVDQAEELIR